MNKAPPIDFNPVTQGKKVHPEQREGEFFLGNCDQASVEIKKEGWNVFRLGETAYDYDNDGSPYPEKMSACYRLRPMFVKREEALEKMRYGVYVPRKVGALKLVKMFVKRKEALEKMRYGAYAPRKVGALKLVK